MADASLLPHGNRTPFELAQSLVSAARRPLPVSIIRDVWRPATCPVELLPHLAAGLGLEVWHDDWPEGFKRDVVARIWSLKRNKTKLKGIRDYLALEGAGLVSAHLPKHRFWWSGGQSEAQRAATVALMPQIRLYGAVGPRAAPADKGFWSGRFVPRFWRAGRVWRASDAAALYAGRATYAVDGVETPVTVRGIDGPFSASLRVELTGAAPPAKLFWGARAWGGAAWASSDAGSRVIAITPDPAAPLYAVPAGLVPSAVRPVKVCEAAPGSVAELFWGRGAWGRARHAFVPSDALDHVYDRITLMDPSRAAPTRQPFSFWGYSRFARARFTAELLVDIPVARPATRFGWGRPWGGAAWGRTDMAPFWDAAAAVDAAKAFRDEVFLATALYRAISFTPGLRFGDPGFSRFGDFRKAT